MSINAPWVYEPIMGNKSPGGRHVVTDNIFHPFCWFFLHYFWICCPDNMSDCFCFWFSSPLTVSCPRFVLQMFITFVVSNRTPIVNLDFSTENRYFKHLSIYYFLSGSLLQFTSAKRKWGCQSSPSLTILVPLWFIIISLVFFYLYKVSFSGFHQVNGHFVDAQNNSKYHDCAPLMSSEIKVK